MPMMDLAVMPIDRESVVFERPVAGPENRGLSPIACFLTICFLGFFGFFGRSANADELSLLVNGKAIHLESQPGVRYNEDNWGVGFQYDFNSGEKNWVPFVMASGLKDSNSNMSYIAGGGMLRRYKFDWGTTPMHFDAGAVAFLMTRKGFKDGDPFPGILPALSIGTQRVSVNMTYIPKVDPKMVSLLFFQLKVTLGAL